MNKSFEIITIPMFATHKIEATNIFNQVEIGGVFHYDQDSIFHRELFDAGFLKDIPNNECKFICNEINLSHNGDTYLYGDPIDLSGIQDILVDRMVLAGFVKKIYEPAEIKTETKQAVKKIAKSKKKPKKAKATKKVKSTPVKKKTIEAKSK